MMIYRKKRKSDGNRGVAIVIVLGLIAVLMMMAVAFSIQMRVERTGAANYRYGVQARHMVYAGLASAITDLDNLMKDSIFPEWDVEVSAGDPDASIASVLNQSSAEYIPLHLQEIARKKEAKWKAITDDAGIQRGRYAFVIINSSGLIDANRVGGLARGGGVDPAEIQLEKILGGGANVTEFLNRAYHDVRYENFPELVNKNHFVGDGSNFSVFSLSPIKDQYDIDGSIKDRVYIGSNISEWVKADIIAAFEDAGVPDPDLAYKNLLHYTDADSHLDPPDLASGCVERAPMINEIICAYSVDYTPSGVFTGTGLIMIEAAYPFVAPSTNSFSMHYDITVTPGVGNTLPGAVPSGLAGSFDEADILGTPSTPMLYRPITHTNAPFVTTTTNEPINVVFDITVKAYIEGPDGRVDEVPSPYTAGAFTHSFNISGLTPGPGPTRWFTNSWECLDPRFNWNPSDGTQWYHSDVLSGLPSGPPHAVTPGSRNFITGVAFDPVAYGMSDDMDLDEDDSMFVADRPLQSLGELGYICYDYWRTVRLYAHKTAPVSHPEGVKYHNVLDRFTIWDTDYRRGLINVNTTKEGVLASVFYQMPEEEYSTNGLMSWAGAQQIAQQIIANGPYTNLSELGKSEIDWDALTTGPTEICKESGIRNSVGMLTARDNFFTVIIRADSFSGGIGNTKGMSLATSRVVAEIWRDPIPDKDSGRHKCFIRSFRFVED